MATRRRTQRRPTFWKGAALDNQGFLGAPTALPDGDYAGPIPLTLVGDQSVPGREFLSEGATVVRIIGGHSTLQSNVLTEKLVPGGFGIARVQDYALEAFLKDPAAGIASGILPSPGDDVEFEDWMWHSWSQYGHTDEKHVDCKAMRRFDVDSQSLMFIYDGGVEVEGGEIITVGRFTGTSVGSYEFDARFRILLKEG